MLTYEFKCLKCEKAKEIQKSIKDPIPQIKCCGEDMKQVYGTTNDWYLFGAGRGVITRRFK